MPEPLPVEYAADEQMRIEALRAAAAINQDGLQNTVVFDAERFLEFLLGEESP